MIGCWRLQMRCFTSLAPQMQPASQRSLWVTTHQDELDLAPPEDQPTAIERILELLSEHGLGAMAEAMQSLLLVVGDFRKILAVCGSSTRSAGLPRHSTRCNRASALSEESHDILLYASKHWRSECTCSLVSGEARGDAELDRPLLARRTPPPPAGLASSAGNCGPGLTVPSSPRRSATSPCGASWKGSSSTGSICAQCCS